MYRLSGLSGCDDYCQGGPFRSVAVPGWRDAAGLGGQDPLENLTFPFIHERPVNRAGSEIGQVLISG